MNTLTAFYQGERFTISRDSRDPSYYIMRGDSGSKYYLEIFGTDTTYQYQCRLRDVNHFILQEGKVHWIPGHDVEVVDSNYASVEFFVIVGGVLKTFA